MPAAVDGDGDDRGPGRLLTRSHEIQVAHVDGGGNDRHRLALRIRAGAVIGDCQRHVVGAGGRIRVRHDRAEPRRPVAKRPRVGRDGAIGIGGCGAIERAGERTARRRERGDRCVVDDTQIRLTTVRWPVLSKTVNVTT